MRPSARVKSGNAVKQLEESKLQQSQKEILEDLYKIRENLSKELSKGGRQQEASTSGSQDVLQTLYQVREQLHTDLNKTSEEHEQVVSKLNFRIEHLRKNFLALYEVAGGEPRKIRL